MRSGRVDPRHLADRSLADLDLTTDDGVRIRILDVVGGSHPNLIEPLVGLHAKFFPNYDFVRSSIERDAGLPARHGDVTVHQLVVVVDDQPRGFLLVDSNTRRRLACVLFIGVEADIREIRLDEAPVSAWLLALALALLDRDLVESGETRAARGLVGEALGQAEVRLWRRFGLVPLGVDYREPKKGWMEELDQSNSRPAKLLWLPPPSSIGDEQRRLATEIDPVAATTFYVDHYGFPPEHPLVAKAIGDEVRSHGVVQSHRRLLA